MKSNKFFYIVLALIIIITAIGLPLDLMAPDAALYASITKRMYQTSDYINLYSLGADWLDKPHMPFWLSALSFNIFGVSNFAYKIPGVLIFFFGVWVTYKFAKELYNKEVATLSVLILITSLHSVISNFDVRAEPFLTGFIVASLYWFYRYTKTKKISDIVIACFFSALAIMTKGIFVLIPIICALGGEFIVKRQWKKILNPIWLVVIIIILVLITPELYALYHQFDIHPEKVIFGKTNVSGIKFFFWDSQFGRFFNTAPIKGSGDIFFFIHTILWAFLPWAILFYIAAFLKIKRNFKKIKKHEEFYTLFATLGTILIFSLSKFQLPHYTNILFPFMAIITADFIFKLKKTYQKLQKTYYITQYVIIAIGLILIPILWITIQPEFNWNFLFILFLVGLSTYQIKQSTISKIYKIFYYSATAFLLVYGFMMTLFYPTLLKYQGGVHAAKYANEHYNEKINFIGTENYDLGFEFYTNNPINRISKKDLKKRLGKLFYLNDNQINLLKEKNIHFSIEKRFNNYAITRLNGKFINKKTREQSLDKKYLVRLH